MFVFQYPIFTWCGNTLRRLRPPYYEVKDVQCYRIVRQKLSNAIGSLTIIIWAYSQKGYVYAFEGYSSSFNPSSSSSSYKDDHSFWLQGSNFWPSLRLLLKFSKLSKNIEGIFLLFVSLSICDHFSWVWCFLQGCGQIFNLFNLELWWSDWVLGVLRFR